MAEMRALDYPAYAVPINENFSLANLRNYVPGAWIGTVSLVTELREAIDRCAGKSQKIFLAGYSQGAWVIHSTLEYLASIDSPILDRISGIAMLADPLRKAGNAAYSYGDAGQWTGGIVGGGLGQTAVGFQQFIIHIAVDMNRKAGLETSDEPNLVYSGYPARLQSKTAALCSSKDWVCAIPAAMYLFGIPVDISGHVAYSDADYSLLGRKLADLASS
jgi:hypothetical protein